jgi:hypothetical protein
VDSAQAGFAGQARFRVRITIPAAIPAGDNSAIRRYFGYYVPP